MAKRAKKQVEFEDNLVLFHYLLAQIGVKSLSAISEKLNDEEYEGIDEDGHTFFSKYIARRLDENTITKDALMVYDERICKYTKIIGAKRGGVTWKYFQYVSLLLTEIYLDRYFSNKDSFCNDLNNYLQSKNVEFSGVINISPFTYKDTPNEDKENKSNPKMNKLAYMCATGSGKTLIMHMNILQFKFYLNRARRMDSRISINNVILLTPNESMSRQHKKELDLSSIPSEIFNKDNMGMMGNGRDEVLILDMNKLKEEGKVKTVSVDCFERNNLVMVDEAHRGMSSEDGVWYDYRTKLSEEGFSFEYSATLKQALNVKSSKKDDLDLISEYGKSIIIDYSYKYFYEDGYGKDYRIYNLREAIDDETKQLYLTGCLMSFFQQVKCYKERQDILRNYNIENPLLVFVGNKVTKSTSNEELSDVAAVLKFIDDFVRNKKRSVGRIKSVLDDDTGLIDANGRELFHHDFEALRSIYGGEPVAEVVFEDMMHLVFHTDSNADEPRLHIENIKQVPGEIVLKVGTSDDYFGLINIGDPAKLVKLCGEQAFVVGTNDFISTSLFSEIDKKDSKVSVLIGSRKFTEGWNSWRVSTMGLINFAKGEGSQAIQLFGRGVRLKGKDNRLKRSLVKSKCYNLGCVETLTIFGVKAQYMEDFKAFLEKEDMPTNNEVSTITLPVVSRFSELKGQKLMVIKLEDGVNFKKQAARMILDVPKDEKFISRLRKSKTKIDCRSRIQAIESYGSARVLTNLAPDEEHVIPKETLNMLDYYRIYDELEDYKNEHLYYNITIDRKRLQPILETEGWYGLLIPATHLKVNSYARLDMITDYAIMVLKSYMDKFYKFKKEEWEYPHLVYKELESSDANFVDTYTISVTSSENEADKSVEEMRKFIGEVEGILNEHSGLDGYEKTFSYNKNFVLFDFRAHLYAPLVCVKKGCTSIKISPVSLNEDEKLFVDYMNEYVEGKPTLLEGKSLYLLRNKSKAGMGFFEADNFYPDYILWIDTKEKQYITFIDPKGLMNIDSTHPKIRFCKKIKELENNLQSKSEGKPIVLNSFILSATKGYDLPGWWNRYKVEEREAMNVYTLEHSSCVEKIIKKVLEE